METQLLHFTTLFKIKKRQNIVTYQPHSATQTYSKILLKIIPTKLVNLQYHTISHIPAQKDTLGWIYVVEWNSWLTHVVKLPTKR